MTEYAELDAEFGIIREEAAMSPAAHRAQAEVDAYEARERDATSRTTALQAALHTHGSTGSEREVLRAAEGYRQFLTGEPAQQTVQ